MSARHYLVNGVKFYFVKSPDVARLSHLFSKMYRENVFLYHSDDSAIALTCTDGMFWANLDISSCDTSQGPSVFQFLYLFCPDEFLPVMSLLVEQCAQTCKVGHGRSRLLFKPRRYFEYSGSLLTTLLNCVASFTIGRAIVGGWKGGSRADALAHVNGALSTCGWNVTCEVEERFSGIQFLKHSPAFTTDGDVCAVTNLGVILRALGQKTGNLPKGDLYEQARLFNSGLVAGFVHCGNTRLLRVLQEKFSLSAVVRHGSNITKFHTGGSLSLVNDDTVIERYGMTPGAYQELLDLLCVSEIGDLIDCQASRSILLRDYGL